MRTLVLALCLALVTIACGTPEVDAVAGVDTTRRDASKEAARGETVVKDNPCAGLEGVGLKACLIKIQGN